MTTPALNHAREKPSLASEAGAVPPWGRRLLFVALFASIWFYVFPYFPDLRNPNENVRLYMTAALVDEGTYEISSSRQRWGWVNDAACVATTQEGERLPCDGPIPGSTLTYFSVKAPLASVMAVPGYVIAQGIHGDELTLASAIWWTRVTSSGIPCVIFLFFFYGYLGSITTSTVCRDLGFLAFAVGSVFLGYAFILASHSTSAVFAFGAFMLLHRARRETSIGWVSAFVAGFLASGTSALEYPCFGITLVLCVMALACIRPWPRILSFGLGALIPTLLVMHFQHTAFGNAFSPGHLFVENPGFREIHESGFFGADAFHPEAAGRLLFGWRTGLFTTTPFFLLAALAVGSRNRAEPRVEVGFSVAIIVALYLPICFMKNWDGGWAIGPRYLVALLPWFAVASTRGLTSLVKRSGASGVALGAALCLVSFALATLPSIYYPHIPGEVTRPTQHLIVPLIMNDLAPSTLSSLTGTQALFPVFALLAFSLVFAVRARFAVMWRGAALAGVFLLALYLSDTEEEPTPPIVDAIVQGWRPG